MRSLLKIAVAAATLAAAPTASGQEIVPFHELPAGYAVVVSSAGGIRVALDTVSIATLAEGHLRARYHVDLAKAQIDGPHRFTEVEDEIEFDCAEGRARLVRHTVLIPGQRRVREGQGGWRAPAPGTDEARVMEAACQARGRALPAAAVAAAPRAHGSGPVPPGWVLMVQVGNGRSLLDSASMVAKGNGVYATRSRSEIVPSGSIAEGLYDGLEMQAEVDCRRQRIRVTGGSFQAGGRDVAAIPIDSARSTWRSDKDNALVIVACRVAGVTPR
ncbi:MAG TPA: hypothetical protein VK420_13525 [Longimicrobium sp.]|jgi:hypothetical protein|nr:hypothetical protein [Longimicrobium sp.]